MRSAARSTEVSVSVKSWIRVTVPLVLALLAVSGCFLGDDFQESVAVKFSYCRVNDRIVMGLQVHNNGASPVYPGAKEMLFLVNGKKSDPILHINDAWRRKAILPGAPKGTFGYFEVSGLAAMLNVGTNALHWQYGPLRSNVIILDVAHDSGIREIQAECEDNVQRLAASYAAKHGARGHPSHQHDTQGEDGGAVAP